MHTVHIHNLFCPGVVLGKDLRSYHFIVGMTEDKRRCQLTAGWISHKTNYSYGGMLRCLNYGVSQSKGRSCSVIWWYGIKENVFPHCHVLKVLVIANYIFFFKSCDLSAFAWCSALYLITLLKKILKQGSPISITS